MHIYNTSTIIFKMHISAVLRDYHNQHNEMAEWQLNTNQPHQNTFPLIEKLERPNNDMYQFYKNFYFKTSIFDLQYFIYFQPLLFYFNFLYQSYKHLHISYVRQHSVNRGMNDSGKKFWIRHILWDITCCMPIWSLTCPTPLYYCSLILPVQSL